MWFLKVKKSSDATTNSGVGFAEISISIRKSLEEKNLVFRKRKHKNIKLILQIGGMAAWSVRKLLLF